MEKYSALLVAGLLVVLVIQIGAGVLMKSPTFDEPNWLTIGWYITHYWTWQGDYHVFMHPPLTFYVHGIPLRLLEWWLDDSLAEPPEGELADQFPYPYSSILPYDTVFVVAKMCMLPISLLLIVYTYRWAKQLYGISAGVLAVCLYVCNPWLIGHATIIGTDLAIACGMFITLYYFWKFLHEPTLWHSVCTGLALGLTLLTRVSALLLFPIGLVLGGGVFIGQQFTARSSVSGGRPGFSALSGRKILIGSLVLLAIAAFVVEAGYLFDMQPIRAFRPEQEQDYVFRAFRNIPIPFGAYMNSIRLPQSFLFWMERSSFMAGRHLTSTVWYYNALAFLLKNPAPFVIFLLLSFGLWRQCACKHALILLLPAGVIFLVFSVWFPVQGFRFVLPIYPFLIVWISRLVTWDALKRTSARMIFGVLIGWYIVSGLAAMPDYLAYCNEFIGGTEKGHHWFADADYDWGQDLKRLGQFFQDYQGAPIRLAYFGSGIPEYYNLDVVPLKEPEGCRPIPGLVAISTTRLQGVYEDNHACYSWLLAYEPIARIGGTILVYAIK